MILKNILYSLFFSVLLLNCKSFTENAKFELNNGYYKTKVQEKKNLPVYVYIMEDTIHAYDATSLQNQKGGITTSMATFPPYLTSESLPPGQLFKEYSFDLDVMTIPFKYRPPSGEVPRQLNTQFNGALYMGLRTDRYKITYEPTLPDIAQRELKHIGFSLGYFTGIGADPITPLVTMHTYPFEYDGVVWMNGIGAFIGVNQFTFGLGLGFDYLLDRNRKFWVYQRKPWLGLALGLNVN